MKSVSIPAAAFGLGSATAIRTLGEELERLVDSMEAEMRDTGTISSEDAERLAELRLRFEQLLEGGTG